jgi:type I restriction enzyme, S subunit
MKRWPVQSLDKLIVTLESGSRPKGGVGQIADGIPSVSGEHINRDGEFYWDTPKHITREFYTKMTRGRIQKGDILIVKDGATTGKTATVRDDFPFKEAAINEHVFILRTEKTKALSEFVGYFLFSPIGQQQILSGFRGAAIGGIAQDFVRNVHVPLPPLAEQERIVKLLDEADALRKLRTQADRRTAALLPALFDELFGDRSTFATATVAELASERSGSIRTGPFGSDLRHSEFVSEGIPVLGIDNVVENEFRWTEPRCVTPEKFKEMQRFIVFPGDVLVTIMGTVGRCVVAPDDLPTCISTKHLCTITVNRERIEPRYLWGSFRFDETVRQQTRLVGKGAIMEGWNSTIIKSLKIPVPPLPLQQTFARRVGEIRELEAAQAASRRRLDALFASLLHRAFAGEL